MLESRVLNNWPYVYVDERFVGFLCVTVLRHDFVMVLFSHSVKRRRVPSVASSRTRDLLGNVDRAKSGVSAAALLIKESG